MKPYAKLTAVKTNLYLTPPPLVNLNSTLRIVIIVLTVVRARANVHRVQMVF